MNVREFVMHARVHQLAPELVRQHFPQLPLDVCAALVTGVAFISEVKSDGSVVIDDGQP